MVAPINGEGPPGELTVGVEPGLLVLADGQGIAVLGVWDGVEEFGVGGGEGVVPGDGYAGESPPVEDGLDEDAGVLVLHGGRCEPGVGVAGVVVPDWVDELIGTRRCSFGGVCGVVASGLSGPEGGEDEFDRHVAGAVWVGCIGLMPTMPPRPSRTPTAVERMISARNMMRVSLVSAARVAARTGDNGAPRRTDR